MSVSKKYAGLPDLDAAPEVYETPELADDVSTLPTGTVRTISPSPSDDGDDDESRPGLDRHPLDRDGARRRFEPSVVDARDVDFSDSIGGTRRAYRTRSARRRRRWHQGNGIEDGGDPSDSEEETLATKLARLKREAEEVRLELERREREKKNDKDEDGEFEDSLEEQQQQQQQLQQQQNQGIGGAAADDQDVDVDGVRELSRVLDGLSVKARLKTGTSAEDEFLSRLKSSSLQGQRHQQKESGTMPSNAVAAAAQAAPATLAAVAAFSDRLTALESALGVASISAASQTGAILPTLASLSTQVTTLSATLAPQATASGDAPFTSASQGNTALLETISARLKTLISESDRLAASRKQALASLADLHDKRMQQLVSATVHSNTRPRLRGFSTTSSSVAAAAAAASNAHAVESKPGENMADAAATAAAAGPGEESLQIQSKLFLDEQSSKITALYNVLPTIQDLQPLLPVVLERLRTLSVIHDGAAQAKALVDALEKRQGETREEIARWREAVDTVEKGMAELEGVMKDNVEILGGRVREVEARIGTLEQR
ncbi:hypothetical protein Z517_02764 [Fonsecaea pedrosoi CBS 271.37]|uniref:Dynactin subunit 2 n=1 Tax=Fonsecaea pedrosoi CBS 271.37 TaxID=1442368 RepID=A0A0D2HGJ2_9EURO|nr:uncharacterized protein Z517_02764 [Fonsecaea pedrosoi CBS 271.37]KIW83519.1 hypothetical protein Z517_02764 [Fonsecaea pedrosoi CBS 271.37]